MILHCVFCSIRKDAVPDEVRDVFQGLEKFAGGLDGVISFEQGPNRDFEGKSQDYSDGFVIKFADDVALQAYAGHPTHKALGARLCAVCVKGAEGIMVFDIEVMG